MKLLIHDRMNTHHGLGGVYYEVAGLLTEDINPIRKFIFDGYVVFSVDEVDFGILKRMLERFPKKSTLRYGTNGMLLDPVSMFHYNKGRKTRHQKEIIKTLYESLYIYFLVKKYCKVI